ncbi:MAG: polysaccharide deacetylase family protein [Planctomycetes bacterium]|nr:polysaccharide deacetylase family protein [Planctomycetota bacterium]
MNSPNRGAPGGATPDPSAVAAAREALPPTLVVLIATEEEFDWDAPFDRAATSVRAARELPVGQRIFDQFGVRATYLCDYPIAAQPEAYEPLREVLAGGTAELGAHLHPWVTPPFDEELSRANSFPGNLPEELERAKLESVTLALERNVGRRPRIYQAGRYGLGARTPRLLVELGYQVDASPSPAFDFSAEGGPDFTHARREPFFHPAVRELFVVPVTGAVIGFLGPRAPHWYARASRPAWARWRMPALLARLRAAERMRLSPEGFELADLKRLTRKLHAEGTRVFTFSFHSPSLMRGGSRYVTSDAELARFLDRCRGYFDFFLGEFGGRSITPLALRDEYAGHGVATTT